MRIINRLSILILLMLMAGFITPSIPAQSAFDSANQISVPNLPKKLTTFFKPPEALENDFGKFRSPLKFYDGRPVRTTEEWRLRRQEILNYWHTTMGAWPPLLEKPAIEYLAKEHLENFTRQKVNIEIAPDRRTIPGYLMTPDAQGLFPAVIVVYYEPETGAGLGKELRDFGYQLAKRGFVSLSIGMDASLYYPSKANAELQPLSALAYAAANCYNALASLPEIDPQRIGIMGHSYGGKWAMFASCLYEKFACAAWSDPGIVFDETRPNVNYWDIWYLGYEKGLERKKGLPNDNNPRSGAYKQLVEEGHDLIELHALMAPRPFWVSGGSEDTVDRWKALNHSIAVNRFLGYTNKVAMTNRQGHSPTPESNDQMYLFFEHFLKHPKTK